MGSGHHHRVWIAFEPNQIKSVSNRGTFDPASDKITESTLWTPYWAPVLEEIRTPVEPLMPESAIEYFESMVGDLGMDPFIFGDTMRRSAFTLAVATDTSLLDAVQGVLSDFLRTGDLKGKSRNQVVKEVLDRAGVSYANPQYPEMVLRVNVLDAYNTGAWDQMTHPNMGDTFMVWKYALIDDHRLGPDHAPWKGKYFPASIPFTVVRNWFIVDRVVNGQAILKHDATGRGRIFNCRCSFIPTSKYAWRRLQAQGVQLTTLEEMQSMAA